MQVTATDRTSERERERERERELMHNQAIAQNQRSTKLLVLIMLARTTTRH
jgi:hypothetical protein